eukprot:Phypoly_transcript_03769.p2 GENE.Phypoly_transcript_03769~~Phypoly_transcript_03769.p2  ORF type:complete len:301 (+),score=58.77 Phypoly_transcript_03769:1390-2292(+)
MLGPDEELESFAPLTPSGPNLQERMQEMKMQRRELGMMFRQYIQDNFGIECYLKRHEQQLWIGMSRCAERRALAQALKEGEVGAHKWDPASYRHFRYEEVQNTSKDYDCLDIQEPTLLALYADASFRMNQVAMKKKYQSFLHELAKTSYNATSSARNRRHSPPSPYASKSGIKQYLSHALWGGSTSSRDIHTSNSSNTLNSAHSSRKGNNTNTHASNNANSSTANMLQNSSHTMDGASIGSPGNSQNINNNNNENNNNYHNITQSPNTSLNNSAMSEGKGKTIALHHTLSRLIYQFTHER